MRYCNTTPFTGGGGSSRRRWFRVSSSTGVVRPRRIRERLVWSCLSPWVAGFVPGGSGFLAPPVVIDGGAADRAPAGIPSPQAMLVCVDRGTPEPALDPAPAANAALSTAASATANAAWTAEIGSQLRNWSSPGGSCRVPLSSVGQRSGDRPRWLRSRSLRNRGDSDPYH